MVLLTEPTVRALPGRALTTPELLHGAYEAYRTLKHTRTRLDMWIFVQYALALQRLGYRLEVYKHQRCLGVHFKREVLHETNVGVPERMG